MSRGKQWLAAVLAGVLGLTACASPEGANQLGTEMTGQTETETKETAVDEEAETEEHPLVVACGNIGQVFSGFYAKTSADKMITETTLVRLLEKDRSGQYVLKGIEGESEEYNGTTYDYRGIADCKITEKSDGKVSYEFTLRDDVTFSDGTSLTADDLIFSMYVYLDPAYEGPITLNQLPIQGLPSYTKNARKLYELILERGEKNKEFDVYTKEQQKTFFEKDWPAAKKAFIESICEHYETDSIAEAMCNLGYANQDEETGKVTATYSYNRWTMKDGDEPGVNDFWDEMMVNAALGKTPAEMCEDLKKNGIISKSVYEQLGADYMTMVDSGEESVDHISGIRKTGDYSVRVTLSKNDVSALENLAIPIQPLHYYGDAESYNYDKHQFGFPKGNLTSIKEKSSEPLGAGPYKLVKYEEGVAYLEANERYYKGAPQTSLLQFRQTSESEMALGIAQGTLDIAQPSAAKSDIQQIRKANGNGSENGEWFSTTYVDYSAYGYVGINSDNVKVGRNGKSQESIYLRKALATAISFYRFDSVYNYYGSTAELINYPISNTSWAAPMPWQEGYEKAYDVDIDGKKIVSVSMTSTERKKAMQKAVLGYLEAAGYTVKDGRVTGAPDGARTSYSIMITGGGQGDHPSYEAIRMATEALSGIGISLDIRDLSNSDDMFTECQNGKADLWCAAWPADSDPDTYIYALYHSKGGSSYMYGIFDENLDACIDQARSTADQDKRKELYQKCIEYMNAYVVEIPIYQRQVCTLYSTKRVDMESVTKDQTSHYTWKNEIEKIKTN